MGYGEPKFKDVEFWWNYEELWSSRWVGGGQDVDGHEITGASGSMGHGTNFCWVGVSLIDSNSGSTHWGVSLGYKQLSI
jgi:hypothetical protein